MIATQHSLVARLKEHPCDSDWEKFYHLYEKPILAVAAAKGLSETDCQDVLQETMVRMCRHGFARYDPTRRFTPFLFGIVKDCAFDALRRRTRRSSGPARARWRRARFSPGTPNFRAKNGADV